MRRWLVGAVFVALATLGPAAPPSHEVGLEFLPLDATTAQNTAAVQLWLQRNNSQLAIPQRAPGGTQNEHAIVIAYARRDAAPATATHEPSHFVPATIVGVIGAGLLGFGLWFRRRSRPSI